MSATNRTPRDDDARDNPELPAIAAMEKEAAPPAAPPLDWQVLLLRYLPQPTGSSHLVKRLAPR